MNPAEFRPAAALLLAGQLLYVVITLFHAGGDANDHHAIFAAYAGSGSWTAVHAGQFLAMAVMVAGLAGLFSALEGQGGGERWVSRVGSGVALVALALYGALQAVDGVANKEADLAWLHAPNGEQAARFAGAEVVRWIEWGMRSYHGYALGLALFVLALAVFRTARMPRLLAGLIGLTGLLYLVQGWLVGVEGFSPKASITIVAAWVLGVVWMGWMALGGRPGLHRGDGLGGHELPTQRRRERRENAEVSTRSQCTDLTGKSTGNLLILVVEIGGPRT
jgi:hypothetical protein